MTTFHPANPSSASRPGGLRRLTGTLGLLVPALAAAAPMPEGSRSIALVTTQYVCYGINSGGSVPCPLTTDASLSVSGLVSPLGHSVSGQAEARRDGASAQVTSAAVRLPGGQTFDLAAISLIQFDQFLVQGPTATVAMQVTLDLDATASLVSGAPFVDGIVAGQAGFRAASSGPDWQTLTDRLDFRDRLFLNGRIASASRGLTGPVVDLQGTRSYQVPVGTAFEFGYELTLFLRNLQGTADMGWSFSLPEGYTMTSARGLAVNLPAVPEPAHWMLMLGGLAALGAWRRWRGQAG